MSLTAPEQRTARLRRKRANLVARTLLLGSVFAGTTTFSVDAAAGELACGTMRAGCGCGHCGKSSSSSNNPIYQSLDTLAGGIERVLGLDRCRSSECDSLACDSSCDDGHWMIPLESAPPSKPLTRADQDAAPRPPRVVPPRLPAVPPLSPLPQEPKRSQPRIVTPKAESTTPRIEPSPPTLRDTEPLPPAMTPPRIVPAESLPTEPEMSLDPLEAPAESELSPRVDPQDRPSPDKPEVPPKKEGSIFDALEDLDDPFEEDARRLRRQYGSLRSLLQDSPDPIAPAFHPGKLQPLTPVGNGIAPELNSPGNAIGSGLRPAKTVQPLRPVSHEEPVELKPIGGRRVLAPYRPSR